jgi:hypothetical protein
LYLKMHKVSNRKSMFKLNKAKLLNIIGKKQLKLKMMNKK